MKLTNVPIYYILCFHDFSEKNRSPDVFIRLKVSTGENKDELFQFFNQKSYGTQFIRSLYNINNGHWRLIHIERLSDIPIVNYDIADDDTESEDT